MATATYIHEGTAIDYTPAADVAAGDVIVQNELVGGANCDIAANTLGVTRRGSAPSRPTAMASGRTTSRG